MDGVRLLLILFLSFILHQWVKKRLRYKVPLPPGPNKLPLVGHILHAPAMQGNQWLAFDQWGKELDSDIVHLQFFNSSVIVLNSADAISDLFVKRAAIYSSRPDLPMAIDMLGWESVTSSLKYGDFWRTQRRLFHQELSAGASKNFHPIELEATHELLQRLASSPERFMEHVGHMTGRIIMTVAYGIDVLPENDPYLDLAEEIVGISTVASVPGRYLVDFIPALKHVPTWFPGAEFKRKAMEWRKMVKAMHIMPFEATTAAMANGTHKYSFTSSRLENMDPKQDVAAQTHAIQCTAASMYLAGTDTSKTSIYAFFLAMMSNPAAQATAQAEIDSVLLLGQLPDFSHEASLPFTSAIVMEVLRWWIAVPVAIPHVVEKEDVYKDFRIPAGSLVLSNLWSVVHDETIYPDSFSFKPERFMKDGKLNPEVKDPLDYIFGVGRRVCPGRHMGYSTVWIAIACILATFNISKPTDDYGQAIEPSHECETGFIRMPRPFLCSITPRSQKMKDIIMTQSS